MPIYDGATLLTGGGGGGLLNQTKYSTHRADANTFTRILSQFNFTVTVGAVLGGTTASIEPAAGTPAFAAGALVNATFIHPGGQGTTITILTSAEFTGGPGFEITFAAVTEAFLTGQNGIVFPVGLAINPATDLGLADGDLLGYFMVGAGNTGQGNSGQTSTSFGGAGGRILQGTIPIVTAATDLSLTIGTGVSGDFQTGSNSTITGGLTLTTGDGSQIAGHRGTGFGSQSLGIGASAAGTGINGYGAGDGGARSTATSDSGITNADKHGFGMGGFQSGQSGDGAIILIY